MECATIARLTMAGRLLAETATLAVTGNRKYKLSYRLYGEKGKTYVEQDNNGVSMQLGKYGLLHGNRENHFCHDGCRYTINLGGKQSIYKANFCGGGS